MIDLEKERLIAVAAGGHDPRMAGFDKDMKPLSPSTMFRLTKTGLIGPNGSRVILETIRVPRGRVTSVEAIGRFIARLNGNDASPSSPIVLPSASRSTSDREAAAFLDAAGI